MTATRTGSAARPLRTLSNFSTDDADALSRQLSQLEQNVDDAIRSVALVTEFVPVPTNRKTAAYTAQIGDLVLVDTVGGDVTITVPVAAPANAGRSIEIARVNASNNLKVRAVTGTVNGVATSTLTAAIGLFVLRSDGASWWSTV